MLDDISGVSSLIPSPSLDDPPPLPRSNPRSLSNPIPRTQVKTWDKVNSGMLKMYKAEVLAKLPVAQHFLFGSLLPYPSSDDDDEPAPSEPGVTTDEHGHLHVRGEGFGDCCGIPIPSAFAAAEEARKREGEGKVRRIAFD